MRVLLIIAIAIQAIGILFKGLGIGAFAYSTKHDLKEENQFGIYSVYSIGFSVFIEVALVLALVNLW